MDEVQSQGLRCSARSARCAVVLLTFAAILTGCVDDTLDGKATPVKKVKGDLDASFVDPGDASFDMKTASLKLTCPNAVASEAVASGFVAAVLDGDGNPPLPPGLWVALMPSNGIIRSKKAGGGSTDRRGQVKFDYAAPHVDHDTTVELTAELLGTGDKTLASDDCSVDVVSRVLRVTEPADGSTIPYADTVPLTIELAVDDLPTDCGAGGGLQLSYSGPSGGIAQKAAGPYDTELCIDLDEDDPTDVPPLFLRGGVMGGDVRLRASVGDYTSELMLTLTGAPASVHFTADENDVDVDSASGLLAQVTDDAGHPVEGVTVQFELTRCADTTCAKNETVSPATAKTDGDGNAVSAYFSGDRGGAAQIFATVKEKSSVSASLVVRVK